MPRKVALVAVLACLAFAAPASADVVANPDAAQVAGALADQLGSPTAAFTNRPETGNASGIGTGSLGGFPRSGASFGVLSTGNADYFTTGVEGGGSTETVTIADQVTLRVDVNVAAPASCLRVDFRFFSNEDKDSTFSDTFLAELDGSDFGVGEDGQLSAPLNFAAAGGQPISVTSPEFQQGDTGTNFAGATPIMRASVPVAPGAHAVYLTIFDRNDAIVDSAAMLDALRLDAGTCSRGAVVLDEAPPAVTIGSPANGSTITGAPAFSGAAGNAPGDGAQVTVRTTASTGQVADVTATRNGAGWAVTGPALAPGTYTAVATQRDEAGNTGTSAPTTFTVAAQPPPDTGPPPPVTGKAVNVKTVKGKVRVKAPGGKFVDLDEAEQIPTGSTVDTRKGTVQLTSTAKGGKTQKAKFFQGLFKVTQSRGKTPITNLKLNEKLAKCPKKGSKKAKTSAKKKRKRRLWGDGKGNFRTSGRRSAATVTGTKWLVEDSCAGTMTRVARGTVKVRDFRKKKTIKVKAGHRYMAR